MKKKPVIGVNGDYRPAQKGSPSFSYLPSGYPDSIVAAGGIPFIIPPLEGEADILQIVALVDGMVFAGGADLDPRRDGFMMHPSVQPMDSRRETFDRALMKAVIKKRIPVFGIGVGMQLLNTVAGGNHYLHIPEDLPKAVPHLDRMDRGHRHALEVKPGSLMERVYGDGEIRVNSMHHMALDEIAPGFEITAWCPDGVVEAIEGTREDWFALGTQFHPESDTASALDVRIFEEFIAGITGEVIVSLPIAA